MSDPLLLLAQAAAKTAHRALGGDTEAVDIWTPVHIAAGYLAGEKGMGLPEFALGGLTMEAVEPALMMKLRELGVPIAHETTQNLLIDASALGLGYVLGRWRRKRDAG